MDRWALKRELQRSVAARDRVLADETYSTANIGDHNPHGSPYAPR